MLACSEGSDESHIGRGAPGHRHSNEIACAGSNGEMSTVYVK